jgi:hypothetical protein
MIAGVKRAGSVCVVAAKYAPCWVSTFGAEPLGLATACQLRRPAVAPLCFTLRLHVSEEHNLKTEHALWEETSDNRNAKPLILHSWKVRGSISASGMIRWE